MCSTCSDGPLQPPGFPIRKSPGQSLFAATRSFSQLTTSFIAWCRQGIHLLPFYSFILNMLSPPVPPIHGKDETEYQTLIITR